MNFMPPFSLASIPTHSPSRDSSKTTSLSVYRGFRESTGTQPVRHARSASKTKCFLFITSIVDQVESPEAGIFNRKGRKERKGQRVSPRRTQRSQRKNGFLIQISRVIFPCALCDLCGRFVFLCVLRVLCGEAWLRHFADC